jgi:hypothetical protein
MYRVKDKLNKGNTTVANNQLTAFTKEVNSLLIDGVLNAEQAQRLIDTATDIIFQIRGGF